MAKSGGSIVLGIMLTLCGAAALALAMVMQRYALSYPAADNRVPFLGRKWPRLFLWFLGLMAYAVANGLYAAALNFGPLSLLACVFTLLLVFNMIFARWLLEEALTPPKVIGCCTILVGVLFVVIAAAQDAPTEFTPDQIKHLLERAAGVTYISALIGIVLVSVGGIIWYDHLYPALEQPSQLQIVRRLTIGSGSQALGGEAYARRVVPVPSENSEAATTKDDNKVQSIAPNGEHGKIDKVDAPTEAGKNGETVTDAATTGNVPPAWLDSLMGVVYPGSLGLDEGIAHLTMKGTMAMMGECSGICSEGVFWFFFVLWISASVATAWWLKVVFARYETTAALPVEYGMVNLASVCSGLIFYNEAEYMETWQVIMSCCGLAVILSGIQCSRLSALPCACLQRAMGG